MRVSSNELFSQYSDFVFIARFFLAFPAYSLTCEETPTHHAYHFSGEVSGSHEYREDVNGKWVFALLKVDHGWAIRLYDKNGTDLTQLTPPYRFGVNHRDILGWHFRNIDNTSRNDGSVNAPGEERIFIFSQNLEGTGGFKPSRNENEPTYAEPPRDEGRGWLRIVDFGLADLDKGEKARMVYMKFFACLTWPKTEKEIREEADFNSTVYLPEEKEIFGSCGLRPPYVLNAYVLPRTLGGDIDGDGSLDVYAPVKRTTDGKRGIAVCRAGTWFHLLGFDEKVNPDLKPEYFDQIEEWSLFFKNRPEINNLEISTQAKGDVIVIERIEKSRYFIYWDGKGFKSHLDYVFVEP